MTLTLTPSSAPYLSCLKKFHTLHVLKRWPGIKATSPALRFGSVIHAILRDLYSPAHGPNPPHTDKLDLFVRLAFLQAAYRDEADLEHDRRRALKLIQRFLEDDADDFPYKVLAVEKFGIHSVAYQGQILFDVSARLDKIIVYHDKPHVCVAVDYKVGGKRASIDTDQIFINMSVVKLMYPGYESYALEIQNLSDEGIDRALYRSNALKGVVHLVTARVQRFLQAESFPAEPGECCLFCPLLSECQQTMPPASIHDLEF